MKKKLSALVDTNVFGSALIGGTSTSEEVDAFIENIFLLITSELHIKELRETLRKPKILPLINEIEARQLIYFIRLKAKIVIPIRRVEICRDKKDDFTLDCALTSKPKPNFIVTGDDDLLVLKTFADVPIITPKEFVSRINK